MADDRRGYILRAGEGLSADPGLKASAASPNASLTFIDSETDGGAPPHVHTREDEAMYVLDGPIVVHLGAEEFHAGKGDFVFMPRGVQHDWDVEGASARVLIVAAPGGLDRFLEEFHAAEDWAGRDAVGQRYGLTFPR